MTPLRYRNILTGASAIVREEQAGRVLLVISGERTWIDRREFAALWRACQPTSEATK